MAAQCLTLEARSVEASLKVMLARQAAQLRMKTPLVKLAARQHNANPQNRVRHE